LFDFFFVREGGRGRVEGGSKGPSRRAVRGLMGIMTHAALEQVGTWKGRSSKATGQAGHLSVTSKVTSELSDISRELTTYNEQSLILLCRPMLRQSKNTTDSDESWSDSPGPGNGR
jgi:hypothetical protein